MSDNFKVNVNNYLANDYNTFKTELYRVALTSPETYFKLRKNLLEKVSYGAIGKLYDSFFNALSQGIDSDGRPLFQIDGKNIAPSYPNQKINQFCLDASVTLNEIINDMVEILMPIDFNQLMNKRLASVGNSKTLGDLEK